MIVRRLDMLCCVKTEAVSTRLDQLFHVIINGCLYTGILGLQVRQTGGAVTGKVIRGIIISIIAFDILHLLPR